MARQMKDSGVEWIGEIPKDWNVVPHKYIMHKEKEICTKYNNEDIISLTMNGVIVRDLVNPIGKMPATFDGYQKVYAGNLLMCLFDIDVTPRCIGYIKNNGLTSPAYSQFVVDNCNHAQYYDYLLRMIDDGKYFLHLSKNLRSSLTEENFGVIKTVKPPINEQKRIADFLDKKVGEIDSVIARTKETIEDYKKYKQAIITDAVTNGLNPDMEMKDSEIEWIGAIPRKWSCMKLRHVVEKIGDIDHYMPETQSQGIPYVMTGDLQDLTSKIDFEKCKKVSYEDFQELSNKIQANYGDVILARYATIGTVSYVDINKDFLVSYSCVTIKPTAFLKGKFLFYYTKTSSFIEELKKYTNSNTQGNVGIDSLYQAKIILPSIEEQESIIEYLDEKCSEIDKLIAKKEELLADLENYKKSLIYEYVTGKKELE